MSMDLRGWQRRARAAYHEEAAPDWLCEATPGAGKTQFALAIARDWLASGEIRRIVVVCPTAHLRRQWADAAARAGLALDPDPRSADGREGPDFRGAVVTYQGVAQAPERLAALAETSPTGAILDELHHAGDGLSWGDALRVACAPARRRLALSGTPFRSDAARIPFVRYGPDGLSLPAFRYGYEDALRDGVCRPLYFHAYGGVVSWRRGDSPIRTASFREPLHGARQRDRLRAAVLSTDWLATVFAAAHDRLQTVRRTDPAAGGLIVASTQDHARHIAALVAERTGEPPALAVSDDPEASATLRRFGRSRAPWLVAVQMVSEGVDLPRLRVGVYATTIATALYFRQVAGRFVRRRPADDPRLPAWLYLPSDPILLAHARALDAARRAALDNPPAPSRPAGDAASAPRARASAAFQALGGLAWSHDVIAPAGAPGGLPPSTAAPDPVFVHDARDRLRARHHRLVGAVARRWGLAHRLIHTELTRCTGVRIQDASLAQLHARLALLETWLAQGFGR